MINFEILEKRMTLQKLNDTMLKSGCVPDLDFLDNDLDNSSISYDKIITDYKHDDYVIVYYLEKDKKTTYTVTIYFAYLKKKYCKVNKIVIE